MYHPEPLPISILSDNTLKYNPSIHYEKGDNIYNTPIVHKLESYNDPISYRYYLARKLALDFSNIKIEELIINTKKINLKTYACKSEYFNLDFKVEFLKQFKNIILTTYEEVSESSLNSFLNNGHANMTYFGNTNTLILPKVIETYLYEKKVLNLTMLLFNMDLCINIPNCLKDCNLNFNIPDIYLQYIPKVAIYSKIKDIQYGLIPPPESQYQEYYYLYTNLPKNLYKNIIIENKLLHYNITDKQFYGHLDLNLTNLSFRCKHLASNKLDEIIVLKITKDGYFVPLFSHRQLLASLYIDYPTIPVCIIVDPFILADCYIYKKNNINLKEIKEFLAPYILLND